MDLRNRFPKFSFESFLVEHDEKGIRATFCYKLGEHVFNPSVEISTASIRKKDIDYDYLNALFFNFGIINAISYYKLSCAPKFIIKAGPLSEPQKNFFKKLFFEGLGEFRFVNQLDLSLDDFLEIEAESAPEITNFHLDAENFHGNLIPVGGGKDSVVTLETLKSLKDDNLCFQFNRNLYPKDITALDCINLAGYKDDQIVNFDLNFDPLLLKLNKEGFLNGHIPFSSTLAFASLIAAYLNNKEYVVLSNEASANEGNLEGSDINHQYSKSYEFEKDFQDYSRRFLGGRIHYFSLLRCLNEYEIIQRFLRAPRYLDAFRSCNVGTKSNSWCGHCAKCLYVFLMLYPFVDHEKLINIFGYDLFTNAELLPTFIGLVDPSTIKPFDCVGTREEIGYSLSLALKSATDKNGQLRDPKSGEALVLLEYFRDHYYDPSASFQVADYYNPDHSIPPAFLKLIAPEHA